MGRGEDYISERIEKETTKAIDGIRNLDNKNKLGVLNVRIALNALRMLREFLGTNNDDLTEIDAMYKRSSKKKKVLETMKLVSLKGKNNK